MYYIYAIGTSDMLEPPYLCCYIGVTNDLDARWKSHYASPYTVGRFVRDNQLNKSDRMVVLFRGTEEECFSQEAAYRPLPIIGLNEASGGKGGHTKYTAERAAKISSALRGKSKSADHVAKIKASLKANGSRVGRKNGSAKVWVLTDPNGRVHHLHGNLSQTCAQFGLLESTLRYNKGHVVPGLHTGRPGGYRAKSEESKLRRENTTGWKLEESPKDSGGAS